MNNHHVPRARRYSLMTLGLGVFTACLLSATSASASPNKGNPLHGTSEASGYMSEVLDAIGQGRYWLEARYRFEYVENEKMMATGEEAYASTLRTVFGYETAEWRGFRGTIEFEDVSTIGNQQFHDGVSSQYAGALPTVADPEITDINEFFLDYDGIEGNKFRLGRQTIILDNSRFVGNVAWRQNDQTFDAFSVNNQVIENVKLFYAYLRNVNNIKGMNVPMASHLINAQYQTEGRGSVTGYAYLLDYDDNSGSTTTLGARWMSGREMGKDLDLDWTLEAATQSDAGDNQADIDANYYHGELSAKHASAPAGMSVKAGFEVLEGNDGAVGDKFTTPLATGHKFNGWADMFLATPDAGLQDLYLGVSGKVDKAKWALIYHTFDAQDGSMTWGDELDAVLTYPCSKRVSVGIKAAAFSADDWMGDVTKVWGWMTITP